jgi:hypothetical protein
MRHRTTAAGLLNLIQVTDTKQTSSLKRGINTISRQTYMYLNARDKYLGNRDKNKLTGLAPPVLSPVFGFSFIAQGSNILV